MPRSRCSPSRARPSSNPRSCSIRSIHSIRWRSRSWWRRRSSRFPRRTSRFPSRSFPAPATPRAQRRRSSCRPASPGGSPRRCPNSRTGRRGQRGTRGGQRGGEHRGRSWGGAQQATYRAHGSGDLRPSAEHSAVTPSRAHPHRDNWNATLTTGARRCEARSCMTPASVIHDSNSIMLTAASIIHDASVGHDDANVGHDDANVGHGRRERGSCRPEQALSMTAASVMPTAPSVIDDTSPGDP